MCLFLLESIYLYPPWQVSRQLWSRPCRRSAISAPATYMSEEALAALGTEKAFSICTAFIKSGGDDGKGTGVSNAMGQGQDERKVRHHASHSVPAVCAAGPAQDCITG